VEETRVPRENQQPVESHRQTLSDLPTDPLLAGHTRKNALLPAPDHDPRRVIVITHQKLMPNG